jgi:LDH2 family malate/lactate/ureidoglycolate dehydrogenase
LKFIRESGKAEGHDRIYVHGEKEAEARGQSLKSGVFLDESTKAYLKKMALELGVPLVEGL